MKTCQTIFIAVKPQYLKDAFSDIPTDLKVTDRLFVSVIAGISSASLEEVLKLTNSFKSGEKFRSVLSVLFSQKMISILCFR